MKRLAAHLIADWCMQNGWMAANKTSLRHPAAWVHSGIHGVVQVPFMGWRRALAVAVLHAVIDTRKPVALIDRAFPPGGRPEALVHVAFWRDQALHVAVLAFLGVRGEA